MNRFLRICSMAFVVMFAIVLTTNGAVALSVSCTTAETFYESCHYATMLQRDRNCNSCCNMAFGNRSSSEIEDCVSICTNDSTDGCISGSGSSCTTTSCTSSTQCTNSSYPVCDSSTHCCRAANSSESVTLKTPVCGDGTPCVCKMIGGGAGDSYETWLRTTCGVFYASGNGVNSDLGFPQTQCKTKAVASKHAVLEYGSLDSAYSGCDGYVQQTSGTLDSVTTCTTCNSGYTRKSYSEVMALTYGVDYYSEDYSNWPCHYSNASFSEASDIYVCVIMCTPAYSSWANYGTGYQRRSKTYPTGCQGTQYEYRCAAGYYGSSTNGTSGCTKCPNTNSTYTTSALSTKLGGTSAVATTAITSCYVNSGTYYDENGTFKTSSTCYYSSSATSNLL